MKCQNCNKENSPGSKFCRFCGTPLNDSIKTCKNGHNYDESLPACPFCPSEDFEKTLVDNSSNIENNSKPADKTVIDNSPPQLYKTRANLQANSFNNEKTVIISTGQQVNPNSGSNSINSGSKLVGWPVTFDLDPRGKDFRLYEGRNRIGKKESNDIVINSPTVSDEHAIILFRNNKFIIEDKLSTNGTYVNDTLIEDKNLLNENDEIKIGNFKFKIKFVQLNDIKNIQIPKYVYL